MLNGRFTTVTLDMLPSANQNSRGDTTQIPSSACLTDTDRWRDPNPLHVSRTGHACSCCPMGLPVCQSPFSGWRTSCSPPDQAALPLSFPHWLVHNRRIRQVWNVIEGQQSRQSVLIFDSIIGETEEAGTALCLRTRPNRIPSE